MELNFENIWGGFTQNSGEETCFYGVSLNRHLCYIEPLGAARNRAAVSVFRHVGSATLAISNFILAICSVSL
jgi:hypothetical protein